MSDYLEWWQAMIVWHVTIWKKLNRYMDNGGIRPPVHGRKTIKEAERFSKQTGRMVLLRLKFPDDAETLEGHKGAAVVLHGFYKLDGHWSAKTLQPMRCDY